MLLDSNHCVSVAFDNKSVGKILFRNITFTELIQNAVPFLKDDEGFVKHYFSRSEVIS